MYILLLLPCLLVLPSTVHAYKFAIMTSPTLGNFRDLSGLINGLLNFRHDVYLLSADDNRTIPELSGLDRMQHLNYRTNSQNPYDPEKRYNLIYSNQESSLKSFDSEIITYECQEALSQSAELIDKIKELQIHMVIVDADFQCYYQIVNELDLPFASLASKSEPYLMQTHALASSTCYLQQSNNIFTRVHAFWKYMNQASQPSLSSDLWLWNTNGIVDCSGPSNANVLQVGGLSHKEEQALPAELDKLCTNAKYGVIVFSLPGVHYNDELLAKFLDVFEQLDQTVIWRTNGDVARKLPPNVLKTSLLGENDLLAHVNVKLMITDADNARQLDALFHGVPLICIPITSSQKYNADRLAIKGHGTTIGMDFTVDELLAKVDHALHDVAMTEKAHKAASLLKGSPDFRYIAVYWLDFIARHGPEHLKPISFTTIQFYMFDVLIIVTITTILIAFTLSKLIMIAIKITTKRSKSVYINDQTTPKQKVERPKFEMPQPKRQETEKKAESSEPESPGPESSSPERLHHQGSKKHKKKKHR